MTSVLPRLDASIPVLPASERARLTGAALGILGLLALSIVVQALVVSPLRYERDQDVAYASFRYELADGTAPVGQVSAADRLVPLGSGVAILKIPRLGVDEVVLEGTTSRVLLSGPGHRRDTVLPGQAGASVVMGRQSVASGVFGALGELAVGDTITTITGQGEARYAVTGLRRGGDPLPATLAAGQGRLTLVSAWGRPFLPHDIVRVDATLVAAAFDTPRTVMTSQLLPASERAFAGDPDAWPWAILGLAGLAGAIVLLVVLQRSWGRWQAWIAAGPLVLLCGVVTCEQLIVLLPNLS